MITDDTKRELDLLRCFSITLRWLVNKLLDTKRDMITDDMITDDTKRELDLLRCFSITLRWLGNKLLAI